MAAAGQGVHQKSIQQAQEHLCQRNNLCHKKEVRGAVRSPNSSLSISAHIITNGCFRLYFFNVLMQNGVAAADQGVHRESVKQGQEHLSERHIKGTIRGKKESCSSTTNFTVLH